MILWIAEYKDDGDRPLFRIGREDDDLVAEWPGVAVLRTAPRAGTHSFDPFPGADPALVEKVHRSLARALLRHLEAKLTLHGSAAARDGRAIAMVGRSGDGKSTFAAAMARRDGMALLADDTLAVDFSARTVVVLPTEAQSWLLPDARRAFDIVGDDEAKLPVSAARLAPASSLVAILVPIFEDGSAPALRRLRGAELLAALVPAVIRFVIDEPAVQLREVEQLERLVGAVPVFALTRPRDLGALPASVDLALGLLETI